MRIQLSIVFSTLLIIAVIFYLFIDFISNEVAVRYVETVEETLNDTVNLAASLIEESIVVSNKQPSIDAKILDQLLTKAKERNIDAKIRNMVKHKLDIDFIVVDLSGTVIYDSRGLDVGKDYSNWNDILLTLQGDYGARISENTRNPKGALYIAAPIYFKKRLIGAVSIEKEKTGINTLIHLTQKRVTQLSIIAACLVLILLLLTSLWVTVPIKRLHNYVKTHKELKRSKMPTLGKGEIGELGTAFSQLIEELEGKKYIENYVQTLTHELKSPLSSIRGAAELLQEDLPLEAKNTFYKNIESESKRLEQIVEHLLALASLENRDKLHNVEKLDIREILSEIRSNFFAKISKSNLNITFALDKPLYVYGEFFLIRQVFINVIENSIRFSPPASTITISFTEDEEQIIIKICDEGSGIPEYALPRIFERFYSLPSNSDHKKGTGLGLPFVKEALNLHRATIQIQNNEGSGTTAVLTFTKNSDFS